MDISPELKKSMIEEANRIKAEYSKTNDSTPEGHATRQELIRRYNEIKELLNPPEMPPAVIPRAVAQWESSGCHELRGD